MINTIMALFFLSGTPQPQLILESVPIVIMAEITAYTASVEETDSEPNIMASGKEVYDGAIACPSFLKLGQKVEIDDFEYTCEDRMAKRFRDGNYFDVFVWDRDVAVELGRRTLPVKILSNE